MVKYFAMNHFQFPTKNTDVFYLRINCLNLRQSNFTLGKGEKWYVNQHHRQHDHFPSLGGDLTVAS